jgi:hypothetical protein
LNAYAYVRGALLQAIDVLGLDDVTASRQDVAPSGGMGSEDDARLSDETDNVPWTPRLDRSPWGAPTPAGDRAVPTTAPPSPALAPPPILTLPQLNDLRVQAADAGTWNSLVDTVQDLGNAALKGSAGLAAPLVPEVPFDALKADIPSTGDRLQDSILRDYAHTGAGVTQTAIAAAPFAQTEGIAEAASSAFRKLPQLYGIGIGGGEFVTASQAWAAEGATYAEGSFSIIDWSGYPAGVPRPTGPVNVLTGDAYAAARAAANETNAGIRAASGLEGSGLQIHEIQPVKFGGSPTDMANKMLLPTAEHIGPEGVHQQFWNPLLRWVQGGGG